ncbi:nitrate/nitrite transporter NarK [Rhizobium sp. ERR 922]|uniref:MFS transporter n=1 Tax=unclassified Rhizobium TaxID=2613769 RepID=UPI0011AC3C04|nr:MULTISPECIES: MFS transporter [unclassified Rhizobium]TWB46434.1 nitrate/nitrite transporter NarK [Rhizobium sp. ERR 922]TWB88801.1 nitrate/nitrite transporter NarK [Rhizobium sp. ERR 942]
MDEVSVPHSIHVAPAADVEALRRAAFRKVIWRMLPILTLGYLFNFLDRTNIAFAALQMNRDIGLSATQFGWGAGILFIGYCGFEVPSNMLLYRFGARIWISRIMISWGLLSCGMCLVSGPMSFYLMRFALGVAEAGFFPGIAFFLSAWFPADYRARILSWFLVAIPVSSVIGGPLGGALLGMDGHLGLAGWQWLFIIEGLPAVLIGLALLKLLADCPQDAAWLTPDEKRVIIASLDGEKRDRAVSRMGTALRDIRVWLCTIVYLGFTVGSYGIQIWLPQILKQQEFTNLQVGWISAVPYLAASIGMILWARFADRRGKKVANLATCCLLAVAGFILAITTGRFDLSLLGLTGALVGVTAARAIFWSIPTRFLTGVAAAGGIAFINTIGTTGGFFGPTIVGWLKDMTGSFEAGLLAMAGCLAVSTVVAFLLKLVIRDE